MVWIAGAAVTAAQLNLNAPQEWTPWTPAAIAGATVGNGSYTGRYCRHGDTVAFWGKFLLGSTSSVAAGVPIFNIPVTASGGWAVLQATILDATLNTYDAIAALTSTTGVSIYGRSNANGQYNGGLPITLGTSDYIEWRGIYEAA